MENKKKTVLFVGSFVKESKKGAVGGQMYACQSLLSTEKAAEYNWILLDTTADSNILSPIYIRLWKAIKRVFLFLYYLLSKRIDSVLIFTGDGFSFLEKGFMAYVAKLFAKRVVIAPRSGFIKNDIEKSAFKKKYISFVFQKVDYIVCQGESWKTYFSEKITVNPEKLKVISNWIDIKKYPVRNWESNNLNHVNILFLAWLDRQKGIFDLLQAILNIRNEFNEIPNFMLHVAGDGNDRLEVIQFIEQHNLQSCVKILGWVKGNDKLALMRKMDIFVLPSYFEGFPNALLEAMLVGLACISSDVGATKDLLKDGENGYIFDPGNIKILQSHLQKLLNDRENQIKFGKNARETVLQNHNVIHAFNKMEKLLFS